MCKKKTNNKRKCVFGFDSCKPRVICKGSLPRNLLLRSWTYSPHCRDSSEPSPQSSSWSHRNCLGMHTLLRHVKVFSSHVLLGAKKDIMEYRVRGTYIISSPILEVKKWNEIIYNNTSLFKKIKFRLTSY